MTIHIINDSPVVGEFRNEHFFLSNMATCNPFCDEDGIMYIRPENYYQAHKFEDLDIRRKIAMMGGREAKSFAAKNKSLWMPKYTGDWKKSGMHKIRLMRKALNYKYNDPEMLQLLLATGDMRLFEGNTWGDLYWGVSLKFMQDGKVHGKNELGMLHMSHRNSVRWNEFLLGACL